MVGAFSVGSVSGGVFNPAVGTGPILIDTFLGNGSLTNIWIYWVGPMLGGVAASGVFDLQHGE